MSKGLKRICMNCGARFYDLDKSPIICPSCSTEFTGEIKVKSRRGRPPAEDKVVKPVEKAKPEVVEEDEIEDIDADDDIVSLDDVDDDDDISDDDDDNDALPNDLDSSFDDLDDDEEDDLEDDDDEEDDK